MTGLMNRVVRRAVHEDAPALFELLTQFAVSFAPEREGFETCLDQLLQDESAWLAVAEVERQVVGYCLGFDHYALYANGRVSWVEEIMVQADMRRRGIGRALMEAFEAWARSRASILTALATRRAAPFYTALEYEESATYFRKLLD